MKLFFDMLYETFSKKRVKERHVDSSLGLCEICGSPLESYGHFGIDCSSADCFREQVRRNYTEIVEHKNRTEYLRLKKIYENEELRK